MGKSTLSCTCDFDQGIEVRLCEGGMSDKSIHNAVFRARLRKMRFQRHDL